MLEVYERLGTHCHDAVDARIVLSHAQRDKGRLKISADNGREVRIFLDRGKPLQVGEYLRTQCGKTLQVEGAIEDVTLARCDDWETFAKACYHLGNRHVKVQVGERWLRILPDHVLEDMLQQMGLTLVREQQVFVPESGAYNTQSHDHGHTH
jgi:urease accessory protein